VAIAGAPNYPLMTMRSPHPRYTWQDYLRIEESSDVKHEFFDGQIYAMAGGTVEHSALAVAMTVALGSQLRGDPSRVFNSDLRIRVETSGLATYPDVSIVCGEPRFDPDGKRSTLLNPTVLVEVLSDSTEEYDRTTKFAHYRSIPTLREYVLVSQRERLIEVFVRPEDDGDWQRRQARAGERLPLAIVKAVLDIDELYAGVPLP
jgi:Uma2 family endonuclease